ncbi:MAG: noncanonical pyrimidine nucleotidase, YjjG family [Chloroflexi bacterium]|nr:noncanonical pyrimidine nucleotidase, YjjG family [Chloroflexota bacterium]
MKYSWLLFDADGTLFDYDQAEQSALRRTFDDFSLRDEPAYREIYRRINHRLWLDFENGAISSESLRVKRFELLFAEIGVAVNPESFGEKYLNNLANASELMDGAFEIVQVLRAHYQLGLITNGLKAVQRPRLAQSALRDCFAAFVISEEVGAAKPDPAIFDVAFQRMGNPTRDQVLLIGDSLTSDIQGGNNYGIDTCWFNPARAPRNDRVVITYEISRLNDLVRILL